MYKRQLPFRTHFGYHIIKVNEKEPHQGYVKIAHILISARDGIDAQDSIEKHQTALDIHKELSNNGNWNELCKTYSQDYKSSGNGGFLGTIEKYASGFDNFDEAAFSLAKSGDFSQPVKTSMGWHIIKLIEKTPFEDFETLKPTLKKQIKKSDLYGQNRKKLIKQLKVENNYKVKKYASDLVSSYADSSILNEQWNKPEEYNGNKVLFKINKTKYTLENFFDYVLVNQKSLTKNASPKFMMEQAFNSFVDESNYTYEEQNLSTKYPKYKNRVLEYKNGTLIFEIMQQEVWTKAAQDTAGISTYYENNKENYRVEETFNVKSYKSPKKEIIIALQDSLKKGYTDAQLTKMFTKNSKLDLKIETKSVVKGESNLVDEAIDGITLIEDNNYWVYTVIIETIPSHIKELNKCKGSVISEYQKVVEENWITDLRKKYDYKVNDKVLQSLVK